jgi:hypothetical protein
MVRLIKVGGNVKYFQKLFQAKVNSKNLDTFSSLLLVVCLLSLVHLGIAQDTIWTRRLDMGSDEVANGIARRGNEMALVGYRLGITNNDWLVVKCNQMGETLWTDTFDYGLNDMAFGASFDTVGNIFVTGTSYQSVNFPERSANKFLKGWIFPALQNKNRQDQVFTAVTIQYDSAGQVKWQQNEDDKTGNTIVTDDNSNSYVSGFSLNGNYMDLWLKKYNTIGESLWSKILSFQPYNEGTKLAIDNDGNIILAAHTGYDIYSDCLLIKFLPNGDTIWSRQYTLNTWNNIIGLAIDRENNIIAAGLTGSGTVYDYLVLKYDSSGTLLWSKTFNWDTDDEAFGVAIDGNDNIFITGWSGSDYVFNYWTIKCNSAGDTIWTATYDNGADDMASDIVVDDAGNPIVTGGSQANDYDFLTIKYRNEAGIEEPPFKRSTISKTSVLFHTTISGSNIIFNAPISGCFNLEIYDCNGRQQQKIYNGYLIQGAHQFSLKDLAPGVHFIKVKFPEGNSSVQKLVLIK